MFHNDFIKADSIVFVSVHVTVHNCRLWGMENIEMNPGFPLSTTWHVVFQLPYIIKNANDGAYLHILFLTMLCELEISIYNN